MRIERFSISDRFCGPPRSGNGGYVCARIAKHLEGPVAVRLKTPPPLNAALRLESSEEVAHLFQDAVLIGEARRTQLDLQEPPCPTFEQAEQSATAFLGFKNHAFPRCFVCGPDRQPTDGLRIFPGPLASSSTIAAPWITDNSIADENGIVKSEFLWAALDCTGGFAVLPLPAGVAIVLGELCASFAGTIDCGERCVVMGWPLGVQGRKRLAGSAVYTEGGRLVAKARAVWVEVPLSAWS